MPFLGTPHRIRAAEEKGPAPVWRNGEDIFVSGRAEHAARRLTDFFKQEARKNFEASALAYGDRLGGQPTRITVRDTATRWGSCSHIALPITRLRRWNSCRASNPPQ